MVITRYKIKGPPMRIAVVADLHGRFSTELIDTLKAEKLDIIACPGDLATVGEYDDRLVDPERREKRLKTQDGAYRNSPPPRPWGFPDWMERRTQNQDIISLE